ncbi:MAG: PHP domain-containing protein [Patescibacteria group bacterium]|jgi:predicted metal-dependent phosphoesterase TrpH
MSQIRGYLHLHSSHSYDSKLTLAEIKEKSLALGMSFAAMTEHTDVLTPKDVQSAANECRAQSDSNFIFIPGFELPYKKYHILIIGASDIRLDLPPLEAIKVAKQQGAWIVLAHPHRNHYQIDPELMVLLDGIEIWNQQYDGKHYPRIQALELFEKSLIQKTSLLATAGLDLHRMSHLGTPYLELSSAELSERSLLEALKAGNYEIKGKKLKLLPHPQLAGFKRFSLNIFSRLSCGLIRMGKVTGKWLRQHNLAMPSRFKETVRRWL